MQLSETVKLYLTQEQKSFILATMDAHICTVNSLVSLAISGTSISKYTTANVVANLPSALINQCIRDARSIIRKHYKECHQAVIRNRKLAKSGSPLRTKAPRIPILKKHAVMSTTRISALPGTVSSFPFW